jgi:hypothetical protein
MKESLYKSIPKPDVNIHRVVLNEPLITICYKKPKGYKGLLHKGCHAENEKRWSFLGVYFKHSLKLALDNFKLSSHMLQCKQAPTKIVKKGAQNLQHLATLGLQ